MQLPKISIVTPSYNQGQFIEQTIDSVLSQSYKNFEYIIIDGGSTDQTVEIIKKYETYIKYWISEPDNGQSDAINKGLKYCSGDVFNWLNSDDYYEPKTFEAIAHYFSDPNVNVLCGRSNIFNASGNLRVSKGTDIYVDNLAKTIGWARIDQPETFFRLDIIQKLGGINSSLHYQMDKELWIRYLLNYGLDGIKQFDNVLANFRLHNDSKTVDQASLFNKERNKLFLELIRQNNIPIPLESILFSGEINDDLLLDLKVNRANLKLIRDALQYYLLMLADEAYFAGNRQKAKLIFKRIDDRSFANSDRRKLKMLILKNTLHVQKIKRITGSFK